jgi:hypothetical protein
MWLSVPLKAIAWEPDCVYTNHAVGADNFDFFPICILNMLKTVKMKDFVFLMQVKHKRNVKKVI